MNDPTFELPPRQAAALQFIQQYKRTNGTTPTIREVMEGLDLTSVRPAAELIEKLIKRGALEKRAGLSRGLILTNDWEEAERRFRFQLPLVGRIAAGKPITSGEHVEEMIDIDPDLFRPRASWLFRVKGASMQNIGVLNGDLIGIHEDASPSSGSIVAAVFPDARTGDGRLTLKRYKQRAGKIVLLSENDDQDEYPPQIYAPDEVQLVGRYAGLLRQTNRL